MLSHSFSFRVRYADTDKMGYLYYGRYADYLEAARTEMMRHYGIVYKTMEDEGIMMPVLEMKLKYMKPAYYDDMITIKTTVIKKPSVRMHFTYEWFNPAGELMTVAETLLCFIDTHTNKPSMPPPHIMQIIDKHFTE